MPRRPHLKFSLAITAQVHSLMTSCNWIMAESLWRVVCRALCKLCYGRPHPSMDCDAYRGGAMDVSDAAVLALAKERKWRRCPECK